jgi:sortase A
MSVPYGYLKSASSGQRLEKQKRMAFFWRGISALAIVIGLVLMGNVALPILLYELTNSQFSQRFASPLATKGVILGEGANVDYTNPKSWFPTAPVLPPQPSRITHYNLSIPKLGIEEATVQIGGDDLMESLIHYHGTALPGQYGNTVVFGHSVLPQFFNPKNYRTIFSTLPKIEEEDEVLVEFDGIRYRYLVREIFETAPEDISVLEQSYQSQWLSLITCVPPGTYLKRLVVRAQLAPYESFRN